MTNDGQMGAPGLADVQQTARAIAPYVIRTPVVDWDHPVAKALWPGGARVTAKLELMQVTGTFKARGAMANLLSLDSTARERGVTAFSAGNHALALAFAARTLGVSARLCVPESVNKYRLGLCQRMGADLTLCSDIHAAKAECARLVKEEGRTLIHPFDGRGVALGAGTLGLEVLDQVPKVEAVIIAIGGGGLAGGMANAIRQARPEVALYGVEPEGANTMGLSIAAGRPQAIDRVRSIADSLGAPNAEPYSFALCRDNLDRVVTVSDDAMLEAMRLIYNTLKLVAEPACAASVAALIGPLKEALTDKRVCVLLCGSNIGAGDFAGLTGL